MCAGFWSAGRSRFLSLAVIAIVATGGFIAAFGLPGADAQSPSYTGCVNLYTSSFRVLLSGGTCSAYEYPITFGETGPPGPPGPPGPAGTLQSAINVGYEGSDVTIPAAGQAVSFDTTYATVGSNIVHSSPSSTFTVAEDGVYRVDFVLQGVFEASGGAQVRVNSTPVGPLFALPAAVISVGNEQQLTGTLMLDLTAGDVIDIFANGVSNPFNTIAAGTTLIITQLTSTPVP